MVSTPEVFTNNSTISILTPPTLNKPSAIKSLGIFTIILDVKKKTAIHQFGAAKSKHKEIKAVTTPWSSKPDQIGNTRINNNIKKYL